MANNFPASEMEGEGAPTDVPLVLIWRMLIPVRYKRSTSTTVGHYLPHNLCVELTTSSEDQTNLHQHARHNAQEAIALARQRAQDFDARVALERKTNEALRLAKGQAHLRDDEDEQTEGAPLVDCKRLLSSYRSIQLIILTVDSEKLNFQNPSSPSVWPTPHAYGPVKGVPAQRAELVGHTV